ncbi:hypothetical protein ABZX95_47120 [Streptomyces sp. NPDC004232]|uniref:hypothetical protein n=1 Tax=Streptomyces sp. NPDC004232 TaxID=3154454 RepID=UPI0033A707B5
MAELMLAPLPYPASEEAVARGLSVEQVSEVAPSLLWMQLIQESGGALAVTMLGAAVFYRTEYEKAERLLAEVVAFADALESNSGPEFSLRQAPSALCRLAQGTYSLEEAIRHSVSNA